MMSVAREPAGRRTLSRKWLTPWDVWALLVPLLAMAPMLLFQWQSLMSRSERQFFPFFVLVTLVFPLRAIVLLSQQAAESKVSVGRARWAHAALGGAILTYAASVILFSPWLAHLAAIVLFFGWALGRCTATAWPTVLAWTGLLVITLPLPLGYDFQLVAWLQSTSSWACSKALDALGVPHLQSANVIEVRGRQLFVEEACSGIGSMYAVLAVAALLVLLNRRSLLVTVLTLLSVPVWSMLGNFARLLAVALAQHFYERDLSHGTDHELLGLITFGVAVLGLWMTEAALAALFQPVSPTAPEFWFLFRSLNVAFLWPNQDPFGDALDDEEGPTAKPRENPVPQQATTPQVNLWDVPSWRVLVRGAAIAALVIGTAPAVVLARGGPLDILSFNLPHFTETDLERFPGEDSMPASLRGNGAGEWRRVGFHVQHRSSASFFGEYSRIWEYRRGEDRFLLSMDLPFRGPHPLEVCYTNSGWTVNSLDQKRNSSSTPWPWTEITLSNDFSSQAFVCYAMLTEEGKPYSGAPGVLPSADLWTARVGSGITRAVFDANSQPLSQPVCYQVQVLCESGSELTDEEKEEIRDCFLQARAILLDQIAKDSNAR